MSTDAGGSSPTSAAAPRAQARGELLLQLYIATVVTLATLLLVFLAYLQVSWEPLPGFGWLTLAGMVFFIGVGLFADRLRVRVGDHTEISAGFLADLLSGAILGPFPGALAGISGALAAHRRGEAVRTMFSAAVFAILGGTCGLVYWAVWIGLQPLGTGVALVAAGLLAGLTYTTLDYLLFVPIALLRRGVGPRAWFDEAFRPYIPYNLFFLFVSLSLIYIHQEAGRVAFALFFLPVLGLVYAFRSYAREKKMAHSLAHFSMQMAATMITALDYKDNYTAQHSAAVARYSLDLAGRLKLSSRERDLAHLAGLLHDLGKMKVPDGILSSSQRLDDAAWEVVQDHSLAGQKLVSNVNEFEELGSIVLHHHEHFDGSGYPFGLGDKEIPLISRIVCVADAYSAMVSDRPYRDKRTPEAAMAELRACAGTQFDPVVIAAFLEILQGETEAYRLTGDTDLQEQIEKVRDLGEYA